MKGCVVVLLLSLASTLPLPGQTYEVGAHYCDPRTNCDSTHQLRRGPLDVSVVDRIEVARGEAFDVDAATSPRFYSTSVAVIDHGDVHLYNLVQVNNLRRWTHPAKDRLSPAYAGVTMIDTVTITGAPGKGYFLPLYRVRGIFNRGKDAYLKPFVAICPGIPGDRCVPKIWETPPSPSALDVSYQPVPGTYMEFEFGRPFTYRVSIYSRVTAPTGPGALTFLDSTFRDEEMGEYTIHLDRVEVRSADGQSLPGVSILSSSGIPYTVSTAAP